jgi:hypothetical protein
VPICPYFSYLPKQLHDSEVIWFGKSTIYIGIEVLSAAAMRDEDVGSTALQYSESQLTFQRNLSLHEEGIK